MIAIAITKQSKNQSENKRKNSLNKNQGRNKRRWTEQNDNSKTSKKENECFHYEKSFHKLEDCWLMLEKKAWEEKKAKKKNHVSISDNKLTHSYYMQELVSSQAFKVTINRARFVEEKKNRSDEWYLNSEASD
jgi:hypothetical protein